MNRDFQIVFTVDTTQAVQGMHQLAMEIRTLEAIATGSGNSLQNLGQQLTTAASNAGNLTSQIVTAGQATHSATSSFIAMAASFAAIQGGMQVLMEFGEMANKARDRVVDLAAETLGLRDRMREIANLGGHKGPDNVVLGETAQMAMDAGLMPEEMVKYLEQFEGSSPAGEQAKHIDEQTKKQLAMEGAKFGARVKLASGTAGDLAGIISQYTDLTHDKDGKEVAQPERLEKAMVQMGRVEYGLNMGRGKIEDLTRSMINTAGAVIGNGIDDLGDLAAIQGVASTHANPRESGTRVRQAVRALRDVEGDAKMFLTKTAGIDADDSHIERLEKVRKQVDVARTNGKPADAYLRSVGFKNEDELRAVMEQVQDLDIIKQRIGEGRSKITGRSVIQKDDYFQTNERIGIRNKQNSVEAGQQILLGENRERVELAKKNAELRMREDHSIGGPENTWGEFTRDWFGVRTKLLGYEPTREARKYYRAESSLVDEAKRVGIDEYDATRALGKTGEAGIATGDFRSEDERVKGFNNLATWVERLGGKPYGDTPDIRPKITEMVTEQQKTNRFLSEIAKQRDAPAGAPGNAGPAGPIPPLRGNAAPKRGP